MSEQQWLPPAQQATPDAVWATNQSIAAPPPPPPAPVPVIQTQHVPPPVAYAPMAYCRGCGAGINPQAAVCVRCGVATGTFAPMHPPMPKVKSTAVVLAVLFGLFGWLYTYKRDAWKFWLNLAMALITIGIWGLVAWVWAVIDAAVKPSHWYESFPNA